MATIKGPCTQGPRAANDSGWRRASDIRLVVIHTAEASDDVGEDRTAEGVANYFAKPSTQASTQLAVDRDSCVRMLPDLVIPWGAKGANHDGLHIEICGRARWSEETWLTKKTMLRRAAFKVAKWCWQYRLPMRRLNIHEVRGGTRKGITSHVDVNRAFKKGDHWDPGPNFPWGLFMGYVKDYYMEIEEARKRA